MANEKYKYVICTSSTCLDIHPRDKGSIPTRTFFFKLSIGVFEFFKS